MEYRGIDVSKYQGNINFKKVKDAGCAVCNNSYWLWSV